MRGDTVSDGPNSSGLIAPDYKAVFGFDPTVSGLRLQPLCVNELVFAASAFRWQITREIQLRPHPDARADAGAKIVTSTRASHAGLAPLLSDRDVSALIGRARSTLQKDRVDGTGIPYIRLGGLVRYRPADVERYLAELPTLRSTSEADAA